jgi:hypothetical protein
VIQGFGNVGASSRALGRQVEAGNVPATKQPTNRPLTNCRPPKRKMQAPGRRSARTRRARA